MLIDGANIPQVCETDLFYYIQSPLTTDHCSHHSGLVLQDLTFIHIANKDEVAPGVVNFRKRWQQFNILENIRRFKLR